MLYQIRPINDHDVPILWQAIYHAVYLPPGELPHDPAIVQHPEIARYVAGWGRSGDQGFIAREGSPIENDSRSALQERNILGATWIRIFPATSPGYGFIAEDVPELSLVVFPGYRQQGIGTALLEHLLVASKTQYRAISLSVTQGNPAIRLYERTGFTSVARSETSVTMLLDFTQLE